MEKNAETFNDLHTEPYVISFAIGYSRLDVSSGDVEKFLSAMDEKMYEAKRRHYQEVAVDRRKNRNNDKI